jgi:hypothetical protein
MSVNSSGELAVNTDKLNQHVEHPAITTCVRRDPYVTACSAQ